MFGRILVAAAMLVSSGAPAQTASKQPTGKWTVEFADHDCILSRPYGTTIKDTLIVAFKKLPMEPGIRVIVLKYGGSDTMDDGKAELDFGIGKPIDTRFAAYPTTSGLRMIMLGVEDDSYKAAVQSGQVRIRASHELSETFAIPGFGPALKLLDQCAVNLGELWGIPKEQQQRMREPAKIDASRLFSSSDYPTKALRNEASGQTVLRVTVDESGKPLDCVILKSSGEKSLDDRSCGILTNRARYEPAKDMDGKPMRSVSVTIINWMLMGQ